MFDLRVLGDPSRGFDSLRSFRGGFTFAISQLAVFGSQAGINPWIVRARSPGVLVYHCIVSLSVWSCVFWSDERADKNLSRRFPNVSWYGHGRAGLIPTYTECPLDEWD